MEGVRRPEEAEVEEDRLPVVAVEVEGHHLGEEVEAAVLPCQEAEEGEEEVLPCQEVAVEAVAEVGLPFRAEVEEAGVEQPYHQEAGAGEEEARGQDHQGEEVAAAVGVEHRLRESSHFLTFHRLGCRPLARTLGFP